MKTKLTRKYPLIERCLEAGSVVALFPLMVDWKQEELKALLLEVESFEKEVGGAIDEEYKGKALKPEVFFSAKASEALWKWKNDCEMELTMMLSEMCSVAYHYLEDITTGE